MIEKSKIIELSEFLNISTKDILQMDNSIQDLPGFAKWINIAVEDWNKSNINQRMKQNIELWFKKNDKYLFELCDVHSQKAKKKISKLVIKICKKNSIKTILDYGCGIGEESLIAAKNDFKSTMADLPSLTLEFAKWRSIKEKRNIEVIYIKNDEPLSKKYDAITCFEVLQHLFEPEKVLKHIIQHIKPGGLLFITTRFNNPKYPIALKKNEIYKEGMVKEVAKYGLALVEKIYQYGSGETAKYLYVYKKPKTIKKIKVAFLGSRPISIKALDFIKDFSSNRKPNKFDLKILTKSDDHPPDGVSKWWKLGSLKNKANLNGLQILKSDKDLLKERFDLINMVFFNDIVSQDIIEKVPRGITNIHFGYLPEKSYTKKMGSRHKPGEPFSRGTYRGSNILSHAILNDEKWQAVTFHFITKKIDIGPIIEIAWNEINETTTAWDLQLESERKAIDMFIRYYPLMIDFPELIKTIAPGVSKYPYFNRNSLQDKKILDPKITDKKLNKIARALSFPNTEPPYFLEKRGTNFLKKYVIYNKKTGINIMRAQKESYRQKITDIT